MAAHTDVISYRWTALDHSAAAISFPAHYVTPYNIRPSSLKDASAIKEGDVVPVSLGWSVDPHLVARFFRTGYEWIPLPAGVQGASLGELFKALFDFDKVRFAHFDPALASAMTMARIKANAASMSIASALDPGLLPLGDLARLHFEHWDNTELRYAVLHGAIHDIGLDLKVVKVTIPWFGGDPLSALKSAILPLATPTEKDGVKIKKVLARTPSPGARISAVPASTDVPSSVRVTLNQIPPPHVELDGWEPQVLWPMRFDEWKLRASKLRFRVTLHAPSKETQFEILRNGEVYFSEKQSAGEFLIPGPHIWSWDGYDQEGVFDTTVLKQAQMSLRVRTSDPTGRTAEATTEFGVGAEGIRWLEAKINAKTKAINVTVFAQFSKPSDVGLGTITIPLPVFPAALSHLPSIPKLPDVSKVSVPKLPDLSKTHLPDVAGLSHLHLPDLSKVSTEAQKIVDGLKHKVEGAEQKVDALEHKIEAKVPHAPDLKSIFKDHELKLALSIPPVLDLDAATFAKFKQYIKAGIAKHWSRQVHIGGEAWAIQVTCVERSTDAVRTFLTLPLPAALKAMGMGHGQYVNSAQTGSRSMNLATFGEGLPIIDIWEAYDKSGNVLTPDEPDYSDESKHDQTAEATDAGYVGAHELGHSVLRERKNFYYSLTHKGSSTAMQAVSDSAPSYPSLPKNEPIDVMLYMKYGPDLPGRANASAVEEDALGLVAMARLAVG